MEISVCRPKASSQEVECPETIKMLIILRRKPTPQIQSLAIQLRTNTISLYLGILKYQMYIACQYSRAGFFRFIRDLVAADDWKGMLGSLKETDNTIGRDIKTIDSSALGTIGVNLTELQSKADDMLVGLSEVRSEVEV